MNPGEIIDASIKELQTWCQNLNDRQNILNRLANPIGLVNVPNRGQHPAILFVDPNVENSAIQNGSPLFPFRKINDAWKNLMFGDVQMPNGTIFLLPGIHEMSEPVFSRAGGLSLIGFGSHGRGGTNIISTVDDQDTIVFEPAGSGSGHGIYLHNFVLRVPRGKPVACVQLDPGYACRAVGVQTDGGQCGYRITGGATTFAMDHCNAGRHTTPDRLGCMIHVTKDNDEVGRESSMIQVLITGATQMDSADNIVVWDGPGSGILKFDGVIKAEGGADRTPENWQQLVTYIPRNKPSLKDGRFFIYLGCVMDNIPESVKRLVLQKGAALDGSTVEPFISKERWVTHRPERPVFELETESGPSS